MHSASVDNIYLIWASFTNSYLTPNVFCTQNPFRSFAGRQLFEVLKYISHSVLFKTVPVWSQMLI